MMGFKVFNNDWTCRDYQFEVGKTFEHNGPIKVCGSGFHFCRRAADCFNYYDFNSNNRVAEVEALGLVESNGDKSVTDKIHIIRELSWQEVLEIVNTGKDNTGLENTGNRNTGDRNTGNRNTGNRNTGDWNTGNRNTGDWNTGNRNTGNRNTGNGNTGDWNTGDGNTGNGNTGDWNTVNYSNGVFCTKKQTIRIFDKETNMTYEDWINSKASEILRWNFELTVWIYSSSMTEEEKKKYPEHETLGGYLRKFTYEEAWSNMWNNLTDREKEEVKNIPNFNKDIFYKITGIAM